MQDLKAGITEIFSSIQGEGIFVGARQIFVRFDGCNLDCSYCDERAKRTLCEYGPMELSRAVRSLDASDGPHHSVSLTGGEPLLQYRFLRVFLKMLKRGGAVKTYLETNGTLPEELSAIIGLVDIVAMDFKLPSSTCGRSYWAEHEEFLKIASKKNVFVKAVVTAGTAKADIAKAVDLIRARGKNIPFILQPASSFKPRDRAVDGDKLFSLLETGLKRGLSNIRIIPQVHKLLKVK